MHYRETSFLSLVILCITGVCGASLNATRQPPGGGGGGGGGGNEIPPLIPWVVETDWDETVGDFVPGIHYAEKEYVYDSEIAFQTNLFVDNVRDSEEKGMREYQLEVFTNDWGTVANPTQDPGVPGPFAYEQTLDRWAGDERFHVGQYRYPLILADFGHVHILAVHMRNEMIRHALTEGEPIPTDLHVNRIFDRLTRGSSVIFGRFAGFIDLAGNVEDWSTAPPLTNAIKSTFFSMIYGPIPEAPYQSPGSNIDINQVGGFVQHLINTYGVDPAHKGRLFSLLGGLQARLVRQLFLDQPGKEIALVPWDILMLAHQNHEIAGFEAYYKHFVEHDDNHGKFEETGVSDIDGFFYHGIQMGRQVGAFFTAFYEFTNILDKLFVPSDPSEYAIPENVMEDRLHRVDFDMQRYWVEHTVMFEDYNKAAALNDQQKMYELTVQMTESCSNIAASLGEVFRAFDTLVRGRDLYAITDAL